MEIQNLMRSSVNDDWGIKPLQNCLLNIMKYIHDFCQANGVEYCIMGGSALGAVRHGGFIPWDDDIDIFMTPENYFRFRERFLQCGDTVNFYLQELGESKGKVEYAKLRLNNSEYIEEEVENLDIHHGVFVDIMILHNYPRHKISRAKQVFWESYIQLKSCANRNFSKSSFLSRLILSLMKVTPKRFLMDYAIDQVWKYDDKDSEDCFHLYLNKPLSHSVYPKFLFQSLKLIDFETIQLYIPVGVDQYLSLLFGDYMRIPDIETIKYHQHAVSWRTDRSFVKRKPCSDYSDERYYW